MSRPIDRNSAMFRVIEQQLATALMKDRAEGITADYILRSGRLGEHASKVLAEVLGAALPAPIDTTVICKIAG